ncbi:hypothetical protein [Phocicoccus pinnipedialis]|uniref:Yip1 domain-containing protein n=1 Tax=Phocicoccus pinnipedialis TaxID=110845 RepID=A0A6V7RBA3_9BACL|nr:hypothetical protein [Jeotgalicoccus pinnipedialis]MBP1939888.1 hypothetical protein [Jeotgalicoccus pinnipedialis]CAD2074729.1 hypothetical protein JEOPIN946_00822 [Jeotgalicoccus pinnipedialis]
MKEMNLPLRKSFERLTQYPPLKMLAIVVTLLVVLRVAIGMFIVIPNDTGMGGLTAGIINPILVLGFLVRAIMSSILTWLIIMSLFLLVLIYVRISKGFIKEDVALSGVIFLMIIVTAYKIVLQFIQVIFDIPIQTTRGFSIDSLALFNPDNLWVSKVGLDLLLQVGLLGLLLRYTARLPKRDVVIWTLISVIVLYLAGVGTEYLNHLHFNYRFDGWRY